MADEDFLSDNDDQFDIPNNTKQILSIQFGEIDIDCWFHSPYVTGDENRIIEKLFICEFCLKYFLNVKNFRKHINECSFHHPPGRKIYEDRNGLCVYEIDGKTSQFYCQCLCLLAKLFLERKTIYFDVNPFLFYVLVQTDKRMKNVQHLIGYFSKEKFSDEFYNLACLMVLPHRQRQGFGRFLISLSFELTKFEKKTGSPEKPLSKLGEMTYKSYWRSTILTKLNEYRRFQRNATLQNLSLETGISIEDVVETLIDLRFVERSKNFQEKTRGKMNEKNNSFVLSIDDEIFNSTISHLKNEENLFDSNCLNLTN